MYGMLLESVQHFVQVSKQKILMQEEKSNFDSVSVVKAQIKLILYETKIEGSETF